eukprot:TRINITY_DN376_c1_g1_i1.p2 TRINITY_DN376_c1_g1~~TRINITY_DN376_c1_g1_i1.p2  ORF type:complete len:287 (+),score=92.64 TRINITY_DN376_c1_g1_i1:45-863(+)
MPAKKNGNKDELPGSRNSVESYANRTKDTSWIMDLAKEATSAKKLSKEAAEFLVKGTLLARWRLQQPSLVNCKSCDIEGLKSANLPEFFRICQQKHVAGNQEPMLNLAGVMGNFTKRVSKPIADDHDRVLKGLATENFTKRVSKPIAAVDCDRVFKGLATWATDELRRVDTNKLTVRMAVGTTKPSFVGDGVGSLQVLLDRVLAYIANGDTKGPFVIGESCCVGLKKEARYFTRSKLNGDLATTLRYSIGRDCKAAAPGRCVAVFIIDKADL